MDRSVRGASDRHWQLRDPPRCRLPHVTIMDSEKRLMLGRVSTAGPSGLRRYSSDCEEHASHMVILIKYNSESGAGLSVPISEELPGDTEAA